MPRKRKPPLEQSWSDRDDLQSMESWVQLPDGEWVSLPTMSMTLESMGFRLGDLVQCGAQGLNAGGIVWRIISDSPPKADAVRRTVYRTSYSGKKVGEDRWCDPETWRPLSDQALKGFVTISPVFCFMPYIAGRQISAWGEPKPKDVPYHRVQQRLRRIDLMELGAKWAELKTLIDRTMKERSSDPPA